MRCHICNKLLSPNEIRENLLHKDYNPCYECLDEIYQMNNKFKEKLDESNVFEESEEESVDELIRELGIPINQSASEVL